MSLRFRSGKTLDHIGGAAGDVDPLTAEARDNFGGVGHAFLFLLQVFARTQELRAG